MIANSPKSAPAGDPVLPSTPVVMAALKVTPEFVIFDLPLLAAKGGAGIEEQR